MFMSLIRMIDAQNGEINRQEKSSLPMSTDGLIVFGRVGLSTNLCYDMYRDVIYIYIYIQLFIICIYSSIYLF